MDPSPQRGPDLAIEAIFLIYRYEARVLPALGTPLLPCCDTDDRDRTAAVPALNCEPMRVSRGPQTTGVHDRNSVGPPLPSLVACLQPRTRPLGAGLEER